MKEQNKTVKNTVVKGSLVACLLVLGLSAEARAVQSPQGDSLVTPELEKQISEYAQGSASPSVFKDGAQEVLPFQVNPYNKFNLTIKGKQAYQNGQNLEVQGIVSFSSVAQAENQKYLESCKKLLGGPNQCLNSPVYTFPTLDNLGVYVQVWRKDKGENNTVFGDFLITEFFAAQEIDLRENETKNFTVNWRLPNELKEGDYYLAFYLNANKEFELWGSPLVPYSWAKVFDFNVKKEDGIGNGIELDKDNIRINDKDYSYRQPAPEISPNEKGEISVELPLANLGETNAVNLKYELYRFGQTDPENLISVKKETRTVSMGDKVTLNYTFTPEGAESLYSLKILASSKNSLSQSNIRFVVAGKDRGVFRFLGLAKSQNVYSPIFCLRDAAWSGLFQGKVRVAMLDEKGKLVKNLEREANIKAETRCFAFSDLKLEKSTCGVLLGEIRDKQGKVVDKKQVALSCEKPKEEGVTSAISSLGKELSLKSKKSWAILFVIIAFVIGGGILYLNNKRKRNE